MPHIMRVLCYATYLCELYLRYWINGNTHLRISSRSGFDSRYANNVVVLLTERTLVLQWEELVYLGADR